MFDSTAEVVNAKQKRSTLPVLIVLFLISYALLSTLVVEQSRTIDSQRSLIMQLFGDSTQLSAMKGKVGQAQHSVAPPESPKTQAQAKTPSTQVKPQEPPAPVTPRKQARNEQGAGKARKASPQRPPKAAADEQDERRTLVSI